jgi:hypothetical protein
MSLTTGHPVVAAIYAAVQGAMTGALADVVVLDAVDPSQQAYAARSVTLGGTWDPDLGGFATEQSVVIDSSERGARRRASETVAVQCIAYSGDGESDFPTHRANVGSVLVAVSTAVRSIHSVDGMGASVRVADQQWVQGSDTSGSFVMVTFTIAAAVLT